MPMNKSCPKAAAGDQSGEIPAASNEERARTENRGASAVATTTGAEEPTRTPPTWTVTVFLLRISAIVMLEIPVFALGTVYLTQAV